MLWRCWLDGRKVIRPVKKTEWWGLAWLSVWNEVETCIWPSWWHCHSLSLASVKSRLVLPFWYRLTRVVPKKWLLNGCMYVCFNLQSHVGVNVSFCSTLSYYTHSLLILTSQKLLTIFGPHLWVLHTHTHLFYGPLSGTTWESWYQKGKTSLDFAETVSGSGIGWAICKAAPHSRQITMPTPHHSFFYRLDALPDAQPTASLHWILHSVLSCILVLST